MRLPTSLWSSRLLTWTLKIKELSQNAKWEQVFSYYHEMTKTGDDLNDPSVFPLVLKACSNLSYIHGRSVHACFFKKAYVSLTSVGNSLMDFYIKWRFPNYAMEVFHCMNNRDSVSWNVIVQGHLDHGALEQGLLLFTKARVAGFEPNTSILVLIVQACRSTAASYEGLQVHGYIIRGGFWAIHSVQNSFLTFYVDVDIGRARIMFDEMCERDVISWSVMIGSYVQNQEAFLALQLFQELVSDFENEPDGLTLVSVLKACANLRDLTMGRTVHGLVICRGFNCDLFVGNSLIDMYSKCQDTNSAFEVFDEMPLKNQVSWNSALSGLVLNEKYSEALSLLHLVGKEVDIADEISLVNILQICKYFCNQMESKTVHCVALRRGYESNEHIVNSLVDAYSKCQLVDLAWRIFYGMKRRDVVLWSTMIAGFTYCGMPDEAIAIFKEMKLSHEKPNAVTIINLVEACSVAAELSRSKWAHGVAIRGGVADEVAVGTAIVGLYSKCGAVETSRKAFDQISQKNIVSWSAIIAAYGMNGFAQEALVLVDEMKLHGFQPNAVTALSLLSACSHGGLVEEGLRLFKSMIQDYGVEPSLEHYSCTVDMLARAGKLDAAIGLINKMPESLKAGGSAWGAVLSACRSYGNRELGAEALSRILELEPHVSAGYLLASGMYAAGGFWVDAARVRWLAKEKGVKVVAGYSLVYVDNKACKFIAGDASLSHTKGCQVNIIIKHVHNCMKIDEGNELFHMFE